MTDIVIDLGLATVAVLAVLVVPRIRVIVFESFRHPFRRTKVKTGRPAGAH